MLFFFSSRRRHTRFDCDWSSDVCSSDLGVYEPGDVARYLAAALPWRAQPLTGRRVLRWIRGALVPPERQDVRAWVLTINFEDLVTCQVITLLREAGLQPETHSRRRGLLRRLLQDLEAIR